MEKTTEQKIPLGFVRVTEVLQPYSNFSEIDPQVLALAADRGTRVHAFCEAYALGLFVEDVDPDCKNYFDAFKEWFDKYVEKLIHTEIRVNDPDLRLSGQIDMIAIIKGDKNPSIIDIKTPQTPAKSWSLQTAAYEILSEKLLDIPVERRICLVLPKTTAYAKVFQHTNKDDRSLFMGALKLYRHYKG